MRVRWLSVFIRTYSIGKERIVKGTVYESSVVGVVPNCQSYSHRTCVEHQSLLRLAESSDTPVSVRPRARRAPDLGSEGCRRPLGAVGGHRLRQTQGVHGTLEGPLV